MDELVYASEKYRKDNKLKKSLTKAEKKERLTMKHEKLFAKLEKISKKEQLSKSSNINTLNRDTLDKNAGTNNKQVTVSDLKNLVANLK